ncbi:MAG: DUF362 domain-containing protein [Chloroflexi bacterium]|nr:DUF362 domain-containing protein [Chloroflexota bacterium]
MLRFHPLLQDQHAVAILRFAVPETPQQIDFYNAAQRAAGLLQLKADCDVTIKPNATAAERFLMPESGIGTHPAFIWGLADYLRTNGLDKRELVIVEDPLNVDFGSAPTWQGTGYLELAAVTGAVLHSPTLATCVERPVRNPHTAPYRRVSQYAVDPQRALLNVPKLKTHNLGITTICLKNLMGLNYGPERHFCSQAMAEMPAGCQNTAHARTEWMDEALHECWQQGLARRLADLAQVITPQLNIVEGIVGRDGTGFQNGNNITLGLVIAGINMVAVDSVTSYLMGFDPEQLIYLQAASSVGLGSNRLQDLHCYELRDNELAPCASLETFKAQPPFEANRMLKSAP